MRYKAIRMLRRAVTGGSRCRHGNGKCFTDALQPEPGLCGNDHATDAARHLMLSQAQVGKTYVLVDFEGGHRLREKICSMGLNSGARLRIISNPGYGPVGLEVRQARLGIGRGMAAKIRVLEIEP